MEKESIQLALPYDLYMFCRTYSICIQYNITYSEYTYGVCVHKTVKETILFKWSIVCKACIIRGYGGPGWSFFHYISYSLVRTQSGKAIFFLSQLSGPHCINTMMRTVSCETQKLLNKKTIFIMRKRSF